MQSEQRQQAQAEELAAVQLFAGLDQDRLAAIANICQPLSFAEGSFLVREGEAVDCLYILLEGTVKVLKQLRLSQLKPAESEQRMLAMLNGSEKAVLGETALVDEAQRRSSVLCASCCRVYRIEAQALRELVARDPQTGSQVYGQLSRMLYQRLEIANNDVVKLSAALVFALEE